MTDNQNRRQTGITENPAVPAPVAPEDEDTDDQIEQSQATFQQPQKEDPERPLPKRLYAAAKVFPWSTLVNSQGPAVKIETPAVGFLPVYEDPEVLSQQHPGARMITLEMVGD